MAANGKSLLWVDDEAELLEPHRMFLRDKGFSVESATNAEDAAELLRRRSFDLVLLDEQMPGRRGLEAFRELREIAPTLAIVMVTKSEEDTTLMEALGADVSSYLVKPVTPRQVFAAVARLLEGERLHHQALARRFVERFRALQSESFRDLDWRGWIDCFAEVTRWDLDLAAAGEGGGAGGAGGGLYDTLRGLYPDMRREFAAFVRRAYPAWLRNLDGDRPPLSVDVVHDFLLPVLERDRQALFVVIDCLRLDQWRALEPSLSSLFDIETTHYFSILPTATPYSRNALFSGLFPCEIAGRFPDWWGEREDETLNAHERQLLQAQLEELGRKVPVRYEKISTAAEADDFERRLGSLLAAIGDDGLEHLLAGVRLADHHQAHRTRHQRDRLPRRIDRRRDLTAPLRVPKRSLGVPLEA